MCETESERPEERAEQPPEGEESQAHGGCRCGPKRCAPFAAVVLGVLAVPLVLRALKRSRRGRDDQRSEGRAACCA